MGFNPLKYFTIKRMINASKILISYSISILFKKVVIWGEPISFSIEPTNRCNLKCPECPSGTGQLTRSLGFMDLNFYKRIIQEIKDKTIYLQLFLQGEPFLNKLLPEMISYARQNRIYTSLSTNGHVLNNNNIDYILKNAPDKLIFSVDGLDEHTYQKYRVGGTFANADAGLKLLLSRRNEQKMKIPFVELQFIVMKHNEHLIDKVKQYGKELGVDKVALKSMQVYSYDSALEFLPQNNKYRRYVTKDGTLNIKNKLKNRCFALWRTSVITWDGRIVPCCFDKDADFELGKLNGNYFNDIWKSDSYNDFRMKILSGRDKIEMCRNCTEGLNINKADN